MGGREEKHDPRVLQAVSDYIDFDTGEVKDDAMQLFQKVLPKRTKKERKNALKRALAPLSKLGITRVSDFAPSMRCRRMILNFPEATI